MVNNEPPNPLPPKLRINAEVINGRVCSDFAVVVDQKAYDAILLLNDEQGFGLDIHDEDASEKEPEYLSVCVCDDLTRRNVL